MSSERSHQFIKSNFLFEIQRPIFWILTLSFILQLYFSTSETLFGMGTENSKSVLSLGFSPQEPFRHSLLPWFFSSFVHMSWEHYFQNCAFVILVYLFSRRSLSRKEWWWILLSLPFIHNFALMVISRVDSASPQPHLFLGLSAIGFSLLSLLAVSRKKVLLPAALVAIGFELTQIFNNANSKKSSISHLVALTVGVLIGLLLIRRKAFR